MKKVYLLAVAVTVSFALLQSVEAGSRGGSRSFGSTPHFSAPSYHSAPSRSYSGGFSRHYSNGPGRHYSPRVSSMPNYRSYSPGRSRYSPTTTTRNPTYTSNANARQWNGNRTTAFNSRNYTRSNARFTPGNRTAASRSQGFNNGRVIARHSGNWNRHWDRGRDHWWHGHRCHFHNGFWFIYDPFPFYPYGYGYGYGYYPYGDYYASSYYDDGYATDEYSSAPATEQSSYAGDSRVSDVQSALAREGYYDGAIDGSFGPATREALRRYQHDHGLHVTGSIDRAVIQALRLR